MELLIVNTIAESLKGPICDKHIKLAGSMESGDSVLSFNYDLLMENALRHFGRFVDSGYLLNFHSVFDRSWTNPQFESSEIHVVKLHGSMNWLRCSFCGSYFLLRRQKLEDLKVWLPPDVNCPKCKANQSYWERLIIPPLLAKRYEDPSINYLWREAKRILSKAEEIMIIGYSFPTTDLASEALLREGIGDRASEIQIMIVNPDKKVIDRFSAIF